MSDLELAVRTIENILPDMPTAAIQKWLGILNTAALKCEQELNAIAEHTCSVCFNKEFGYRTELPIGWREKGDIKMCFQHEDAEVAEMLKKGIEAEAPEPVDTEETLDELLALI